VGRNPLDITAILQSVRPYAGNGRQGGGYSAIDSALHDITGKVFGVPVWRLLGDKKRDRVRMYCDTPGSVDPKEYGQRMVARKKLGYTFFKMDIRAGTFGDRPGTFDQFGQLTDRGLGYASEIVTAVKDAIGWDQPLAIECSSQTKTVPGGPRMPPIKDAIRMARTYEKFNPAWVEDLFNAGSVWYWQGYKAVREATTAKILTGEDGFGLEECFKALIDNKAVDIVQPDPGTSGQCRETKRIADYAYDHDVNVAFHMAGSPLGTLSAVHCAATLQSFLAMECHAVDFMSWWQELVTGVPKPLIDQGYITVPDTPGLGIELNEPVIKEHLRVPGFFEPTPEFDKWLQRTNGPFPHFNEDGKWVTEIETFDK
jgi:L-alanine-DL-glutamate epimerase-like enolase superfamily enzyme